MNKKIRCMACFLVLAIFSIGCSPSDTSAPAEPPQIAIAVDNQELDYLTAKYKWQGKVYDREDTFVSIMKEAGVEGVPYIETGKIVEISFKDNPPKNFDIYDILVDEYGRQMYQDKVTKHIPVKLHDGKCSFELERNAAIFLSSTFTPGDKVTRGFRMIAAWGEDACEYTFIIKSDL